MKSKSNQYYLTWWVLLIIFFTCVWIALTIGQYSVDWRQTFDVIFQTNISVNLDNQNYQQIDNVIWQLRIPRIIGAILIGAGLAVAGATYQSMFRNPLVSPDILGVSAGAGLGAVIGIVTHQDIVITQIMAFTGGLLVVFLVYFVAQQIKRRDPILVLVLAGVAISAFITAIISLITVLVDPYSELVSITFWLLGGLGGANLAEILRVLPLILISFLPLVIWRWRINVLSLPEDEAKTLGLDVRKLRLMLVISATLITASIVSFAGIVAWVGLLIPHAARLLVGADFYRLLTTSVLLGAIFMLITDTLARSIGFMELPLGVITSVVGAPFFLVLLARTSR